MAGEDTVVSVTTSSGCYSERRIDHATDFCESTSAVPSHSQSYQPCSFAFQKCSFGKKTIVWRAFQAKWFDSYSWLHYDEANNVAFCYLCKKATAEKKLMASKCSDEVFTSRGFCNWKDAMASFTRHEQSKSHKEATHAIFTVPSCYKDCAEMLSQHAKEKSDNRHMLKFLNDLLYSICNISIL